MNHEREQIKKKLQILLVETILIICWILIIPSYSNYGLFNLSTSRVLLLGGFILFGFLISITLFIISKKPRLIANLDNLIRVIVESPKISLNLFSFFIFTSSLSTLFLIFLYFISNQTALFFRVLPIFIFIILFTYHLGQLIKSIQRPKNWEYIKKNFLEFLQYIVLAFILSIIVIVAFINEKGFDYITRWGTQYSRHTQVLESTAKTPWTYRVFSAYITQAIISFIALFREWRSVATGFIILRIFQTTLIFYLSTLYFKKLEIKNKTLLMLSNLIIAWAFIHAHYDSDLSFNVYFDIIFFLFAAIAILDNKTHWIIPISIFAALNRETAILIPLLLIAAVYFQNNKGQFNKRDFAIGVISTILFLGIQLGIRSYINTNFHPPAFIIAQGHYLGIDLLLFNVTFRTSWVMLFKTYNLIPILSIFFLKESPKMIQLFFWMIIPIWVITLSFLGVFAETRIFLVPYILIILPIVLSKIARSN